MNKNQPGRKLRMEKTPSPAIPGSVDDSRAGLREMIFYLCQAI
jgi:hypothetical protein